MSDAPVKNLLGQLALEHGLITEDQLQKSLELQKKSANSPLGQVLKDLGYINSAQLRFLEARQTDTIRKTRSMGRSSKLDQAFGKLVIQRGFATEKQVFQARERKAVLKSQGQRIHIGEVLVEMGFLTAYQMRTLLSKRFAQILQCAACDVVVKYYAVKDGYRVRCERCRSVLRTYRDPVDEDDVQEAYFDEERAEPVGQFGRVAMKEGFLDQEQVVKALQHQATEAPQKTLPEILQDLAILDDERLTALQTEYEKSGLKRESRRNRKLRKCSFGEAAIQLEFTHEEFVKEALAKQSRKQQEGIPRRLGTVMVDQGDLTAYQVLRVLEAQGKRIVRCRECLFQFNVAIEEVEKSECPTCKKSLVAPEEPESIEIKDDLTKGAQELAVIDLGGAGEVGEDTGRFATDDSVTLASRSLRRFYKEVGLLDEAVETDTGSLRDSGPRPAIETIGSSKFETRRAELSQRAVEARTEKRWTVPILGASVAGFLILVSVVGFLVTYEPPPPRTSIREAPQREEAGPIELVDGVRLDVYGVIPAGKPTDISDVGEARQAFLLEVRPGELFWVVDSTGGSYDRLQFLASPVRPAEGNPVRIRAVFQTRSPVELRVPVLASVKGYLVVEEWQVLMANALPPVDGQRLFAAPPKAVETPPAPPPGETGTPGGQ